MIDHQTEMDGITEIRASNMGEIMYELGSQTLLRMIKHGFNSDTVHNVIDCRQKMIDLQIRGLNHGKSADDLLLLIEQHLPKKYDDIIGFYARSIFVNIFSWSIPCKSSLNSIIEFIKGDSLLEIGGGRGLWSALFSASGIDTVCTSSSADHNYWFSRTSPKYQDSDLEPICSQQISSDILGTSSCWCEVDFINSDKAIAKYSERTCLFVSWDAGALSCLKSFTGNKLIVIGEGDGGCTGYVHDGDCGFNLIDTVDIRNWCGIRDTIWLYIKS
jgi:hypothetical protein